MTKAVKQVCEYVFEKSDIPRIYAEPFVYNTASCRVLEKAGCVLNPSEETFEDLRPYIREAYEYAKVKCMEIKSLYG